MADSYRNEAKRFKPNPEFFLSLTFNRELYNKNFPNFQKPKVLGGFSLDGHRRYCPGVDAIKRFCSSLALERNEQECLSVPKAFSAGATAFRIMTFVITTFVMTRFSITAVDTYSECHYVVCHLAELSSYAECHDHLVLIFTRGYPSHLRHAQGS